MSQNDLKEAVQKLEKELHQAEGLDPELRDRLAEVGREIDDVLRGEHEDEGLSEKLQDLLLALETNHPTLTTVVDAITRQLSRLGI
ncbi:MAG: DUF4404 family protein [bacterium]|nr:DUF4404 family protein [bacterium]MCP5071175.1 DUF4404 family protein [bacterium]